VANGGTLVAEGCPGYFDERAHAGPTQPNLGLDELFGVVESYVEFTPDLLGDLQLNLSGIPVRGGILMQAYQPTTGTPVGWYGDGQVAAVDNAFGRGKTRLLGTMCGAGYAGHPQDRVPTFFEDVLRFAGKRQHVISSDPRVKARIHDGIGGSYLWVANSSRQPLPVRLVLSLGWGPFSSVHSHWGTEATVDVRTITLVIGARDFAILRLE
jgi:beta-galactosidase